MTLEEIKGAINSGKTVHWSIPNYTIEKAPNGELLIVHSGGHAIGLTWMDGGTLNGKEEAFFIAD